MRLKWIEELPKAQPSQEQEAGGPLVAPPVEEMEILHRLAQLGNMQDILQRANYLSKLDERYRPFAGQLSLLAKEYRSKAIASFVQQYIDSTVP